MFSPDLKREISMKVQEILRATNHDELPASGEIKFILHVDGDSISSWANICNESHRNVPVPGILVRNLSVR